MTWSLQWDAASWSGPPTPDLRPAVGRKTRSYGRPLTHHAETSPIYRPPPASSLARSRLPPQKLTQLGLGVGHGTVFDHEAPVLHVHVGHARARNHARIEG